MTAVGWWLAKAGWVKAGWQRLVKGWLVAG
jgi:hypothetical protein